MNLLKMIKTYATSILENPRLLYAIIYVHKLYTQLDTLSSYYLLSIQLSTYVYVNNIKCYTPHHISY